MDGKSESRKSVFSTSFDDDDDDDDSSKKMKYNTRGV